MASVSPFRAARFSEAAGPIQQLVAPPYDVVSASERGALLEQHPHVVANLTLNESEEEAGRLFQAWLADGVLVQDARPAYWVTEEDFTGPDGIPRTRHGVVASLGVEPHERRVVLPHERTHAEPLESRIRLVRAADAQIEPIFLLYDGEPPLRAPGREPDLEVGGIRLWRVEDGDGSVAGFFADRQLLIADGHHRYEAALAHHREQGTPESGQVLAVLVSTGDPGLAVYPTHRVFAGRPDIASTGDPAGDVGTALRQLDEEPFDRAAVVAYRDGAASIVRGEPGELDVELVDSLGHEGISYTPDAAIAVEQVDSGAADVAFLMRPTPIDRVFERARAGRLMPQKSTYFYPKLTSGLLFLPL